MPGLVPDIPLKWAQFCTEIAETSPAMRSSVFECKADMSDTPEVR
jgi:hypothetical protein